MSAHPKQTNSTKKRSKPHTVSTVINGLEQAGAAARTSGGRALARALAQLRHRLQHALGLAEQGRLRPAVVGRLGRAPNHIDHERLKELPTLRHQQAQLVGLSLALGGRAHLLRQLAQLQRTRQRVLLVRPQALRVRQL